MLTPMYASAVCSGNTLMLAQLDFLITERHGLIYMEDAYTVQRYFHAAINANNNDNCELAESSINAAYSTYLASYEQRRKDNWFFATSSG
jgi:hypothetical protein